MKQILLFMGLFIVSSSILAQKYTVSGHVYDKSGESLIGANVIVKELTVGTVTNTYGFYSITLPKGKYTLLVSYVGFQDIELEVDLSNGNEKKVFNLEEASRMIESVVVKAEKQDVNIRDVSMSTDKIDIRTIEKIPTLFGETDLIKVVQLKPGVSVIGEGTSGFYVRGGAVDQNLILLDEAIVYNPAHFGGFFSVFNPDAVKSVDLYKGGMPAKFGGRQASVLDVKMREGSFNKHSFRGGIGAISSRLTLEGPVVKDQVSVLLSGRRTYYDQFFPLFKDPVLKESGSYFGDLNAKINYKVNENNRVFLSLYSGKDVLNLGGVFAIEYGNATGTLRWNHLFNDRLFSNFMFIGSRYNYSLGQPTGGLAFDWTSQIVDYSFKNDYTYFLNPSNTIDFGVQVIYHKLKPGKFEPLGESNFIPAVIPKEFSYESAIYLGNEQTILEPLTLQYGMRLSLFNNAGGVENDYAESGEFIAGQSFNQGNITNTFYGLEPRFGARYMINPKSSVKLNYNRMIQYLHLATNTQAPTPFDIWFTSNTNIEPQVTDQIAAGYFRNFKDNMFETSIEGYYKWLSDAIDFKDHAEVFGNEQLDGEIRQGNGHAYGVEFYIKKNTGKLTGWISYTYSVTRRKIDGINGNRAYPTSYDRPNDIKIVANYSVTPNIDIAANWVYYTALPFTVATSYSRYNNAFIPKFSDRNSFRFPGTDYHRLDLSATYKFRNKGRLDHSLTASVYNVYNRHNLYSILYVEDPSLQSGIGINKMYLFKVIPTITYNFKF